MTPTTAHTRLTTPPADVAEIRRTLNLLAVPGGVLEIRGLHVPTGRAKPCTVAGYFTDGDEAAKGAAALSDGKAVGVYLVLNEVNPALLGRSPNKLTRYLETTTSDGDVIRRRWLPLDFDPKRPAGISATADEHCTAQDTARACWGWLHSLGWPAPILADSGNGADLLYRIDLPNDEASTVLIRAAIEAVAQRFSGQDVDVDRKVFNAARIWKLYGTAARKGYDMPDRPHRLAQLIEVPEPVEAVRVELLQALAGTVKPAGPSRPPTTGNGQFTSRLDVPRWLADRGVGFKVKDRATSDGRTVYTLDTCPFDAGHGRGGEVCIMQAADGKLSASCFHASCAGRGWQQFKEAIGGARTAPLRPAADRPRAEGEAKVQARGDRDCRARPRSKQLGPRDGRSRRDMRRTLRRQGGTSGRRSNFPRRNFSLRTGNPSSNLTNRPSPRPARCGSWSVTIPSSAHPSLTVCCGSARR